MLKKTFDKFLRKLSNKQRYFIDSSVLLEIIFKQDYVARCCNFLNSTKSGNRVCVVSNAVMGEVLCALLFGDMPLDDDSIRAAFDVLLELTREFLCVTIDKETIDTELRISAEEGDRLQQLDLLNLSSAVQCGATAFVTLDTDFSTLTGEKFGIKILNLKRLKA